MKSNYQRHQEDSPGPKSSASKRESLHHTQLILKTDSIETPRMKKKSVVFNEQNTFNEESTAETNTLENLGISKASESAMKSALSNNKNSILYDFWYTEARNFVKNVTISQFPHYFLSFHFQKSSGVYF